MDRNAFLLPKDFVASPQELERRYQNGDATAYTRWLATIHYENFHVVSLLLPRHLHQDFYNVYAFCRWSDDLGDEIGDTRESLRLLAWWRGCLEKMYRGEAIHPVFVALRGTVARHRLPIEPFSDLITAFEQDQTVTRYQDWDDLFRYCKYSANPVGRLVLYLCGYSDPERQSLFDATCTALQLANFWQDVSVDLLKDRVYIPVGVLSNHGYPVEDLWRGREDQAFRGAMAESCEVARDLFRRGLPLIGMVDRRLSLDLDLFSRGGLEILRKIERQGFNVLKRRPAISKVERVALLLRSLARLAFPRAA